MRNSGFTLIEVLIVIAIFAMIILVGVPLTGGWVTDANRLETEGQLTQAMGRAKAAALRNYMGATNEEDPVTKEVAPVAAICLSDANLLTIRQGTPGSPPTAPSCDPATGTQLWQAQLHKNIKVKVKVQPDSADFVCMCFDNRGVPTQGGSCSSCTKSMDFSLIAGGETEPVALY